MTRNGSFVMLVLSRIGNCILFVLLYASAAAAAGCTKPIASPLTISITSVFGNGHDCVLVV